jgi:hypothetical protein
MPAYSDTSPAMSASSAVSESDLGSELSFKSVQRDTQPTSGRQSTTMNNGAQLNGLSFHPTYSAKDHMVIFQVSTGKPRPATSCSPSTPPCTRLLLLLTRFTRSRRRCSEFTLISLSEILHTSRISWTSTPIQVQVLPTRSWSV